MLAPLTDVFYQPSNSPDWQVLKSVYSVHEPPDPNSLVKASLLFYDIISFANAAISKSQTQSDHSNTLQDQLKSYMKQGFYGTYYLLNPKKRQE
jgi:hypothetical protein